MVQNTFLDGVSHTDSPVDLSGTLSKDEKGYIYPVSPNRQKRFQLVIFFSIIEALLASSLGALLPGYLMHTNKTGDGYSLLFFVSFSAMVALLFLCMVRHIWDKGFHFWYGIAIKEVVSCGVVRTVCTVLIVYSFDENRVPCHLQEILVSLTVVYVMIAEIFNLFKGNSHMSKRGMFSCLFLSGGIFLMLITQAANRYKCRGKEVFPAVNEWSIELGMIWSLVCSLAVLVLAWNSMHVPLGFRERLVEGYFHKKPHRLSFLTMVNVSSFITVIFLFWTDTFKTIGKASSLGTFLENFRGGIYCHFSSSPESGSTALYGWLFIVCFISYNFATFHIFFLTGNRALPILLSVAGLSVSRCWWYFFQLSEEGMVWHPQVDGSFYIWLVGCLIMFGSFWVFYKKEFSVPPEISSRFSSLSKTETEV